MTATHGHLFDDNDGCILEKFVGKRSNNVWGDIKMQTVHEKRQRVINL